LICGTLIGILASVTISYVKYETAYGSIPVPWWVGNKEKNGPYFYIYFTDWTLTVRAKMVNHLFQHESIIMMHLLLTHKQVEAVYLWMAWIVTYYPHNQTLIKATWVLRNIIGESRHGTNIIVGGFYSTLISMPGGSCVSTMLCPGDHAVLDL